MRHQQQGCFDRRITAADDHDISVVVVIGCVQPIGHFLRVVSTGAFKQSCLSLPAHCDQHLLCRKRFARFRLDLELPLSNFPYAINLCVFFDVQLLLVNQAIDAGEKFVLVQIFVELQFAFVLHELRLGVDFLTRREAADRAGNFVAFKNDVLESPLVCFHCSGQPGRPRTDDHEVEPLRTRCGIFVEFHLRDDAGALVRGHLDQRQSGDIANDVNAFDTRLVTAIDDRQDFLRRNRGKIGCLLAVRLGCVRRHRTSLYEQKGIAFSA